MNLRRTRAVARKEFRHIIRDPRSLIMALAVPLIMLILFGYALTLDVDRIPTLIYDLDRTPQSRELIDRFRGSRYFQLIGSVDDYRTIERQIDRDRCLMAVVIPEDYAERLIAGQETRVQILLDGSDSNTASIALGYAEALIDTYALELQMNALARRGGRGHIVPVRTRLRVWYNNQLKSRNYIVPGLIAVILMIIAALLTSLTIAREWEWGTMEQLLSTPLRPAELVLGKMMAFFIVGCADMLIAVGTAVFVFRVPLRGNPLFLILTSCIFLAGALCWGILLSALARSQLLAYQLGMLTSFLPAFLLSGFIYAIENMPVVIQLITYLVPARYFIVILKAVFLKGVGMKIVGWEVAWLVGFAGVVFWLASRRLKRTLE